MKPTDHHEAVFAELEWYANGTLAPSERVRVREHLAACAVCRSELQLIERSMAAAVVAPQPDGQAVEKALARTLARIEREAAAAAATVRRAMSPTSNTAASPIAGAAASTSAGAAASPIAAAPASTIAGAPASPVPWLQRWLERAAAALRAAASRPLMLGAATVAAISLMVVAPMALRQGGSDDYRVLTNGGESSAARVVLRVTFKAHTSRAQVTSLLGDAARDTTIEQLGSAVYTLQLPSTADLDTVSRLHERFARDATVDSVKLEVGAR